MEISQLILYQSRVAKKRRRIDALEEDIERGINNLEGIKQKCPHLINVFNDYLIWCTSVLKLKGSTLSTKQKIEIEKKLKFYEGMIVELTLKYSFSSSPNFSKQLIIGYGNFLQSGLKFYSEKVDAFNLMLGMNEVFYLTYSKAPTLASYTLIALLARFTLSKDSPLYLQLYRTILGKVKQSLPQAYANPSDDNIFGLLFLTFISLSHFNITSCIRYFGLAVRMAQSLGCDKMLTESNDLLVAGRGETLAIEKGRQIWISISAIYFLLATLIPNIPSFKIKLASSSFKLLDSDSSEYNNKSIANNYSSYSSNPVNLSDSILDNNIIVAKAQLEILIHIQNVKLKNVNKVSLGLIPPNEFRLPSDKFNKTVSNLISDVISKISRPNIHYELIKKNSFDNLVSHLNNSKENLFAYQWNAFRQATIITLYYPSVLIFPQEVKFSFDESIILFEAAQFVTDYYFNINFIKNNNHYLLPESSIGCLTHNDGFSPTYNSPYYINLIYALYVYLCFACESEWLFSQGFTNDKISRCEAQVPRIIIFLLSISVSSITNERKDALNTLEYFKLALKNFKIPEPLYSTLKSLFIQH